MKNSPAPINQPEFRNLVCTPIIPFKKTYVSMSIKYHLTLSCIHYFCCSLSHACIHSFNQAFICGFIHYMFFGETSKVGNNTPLCPSTSKYYTTLILAGDLRNQMQCRTLVCLKIGYPWLPRDYHHHHHHHTIKVAILGKIPHVQTPVIIILVISVHDIRMIIPMIADQILIGIHNIIMFNIILMIIPIVLIIIPFIISSLSTIMLFTNWHWYCFSRCKNIDLTYIPINILTELYTIVALFFAITIIELRFQIIYICIYIYPCYP